LSRKQGTAKEREERPSCTAGFRLGYNESESHRRKEDGKAPKNKKTIVKQAIDLVTGPASTATIKLAADLKGTHELISDVSFQPQHADNHNSKHQRPK
jgi:hypothetical protein